MQNPPRQEGMKRKRGEKEAAESMLCTESLTLHVKLCPNTKY